MAASTWSSPLVRPRALAGCRGPRHRSRPSFGRAASTCDRSRRSADNTIRCGSIASMSLPMGDVQVWLALISCAGMSMALEEVRAVSAVVSGVVIAMAFAAALSLLGILPSQAAAYDTVWAALMPLGAALLLLGSPTDAAPARAAPQALTAFAVAAAGTVAGTAAAWAAFGHAQAPGGAAVTAALCATYIGGSLNFAAVIQALKVQDSVLVASTLAIDNIAMALYFAAMALVPVPQPATPPTPKPAVPAAAATGPHVSSNATPAALSQIQQTDAPASNHAKWKEGLLAKYLNRNPDDGPTNARNQGTRPGMLGRAAAAGVTLAVAAACCAAGEAVAEGTGASGFGLAFMAVSAVAVNAVHAWLLRRGSIPAEAWLGAELFSGLTPAANLCMALFFATIGASAGAASLAGPARLLVPLVATQIAVHAAAVAAGVLLLRVPRDLALVASNAAIGGPATAAAMAAARGWPQLVRPAVFLGSIGYATGTWIGLAMFQGYLSQPL
eukprot:jgi/Ulvmu1/5530/UM023_0066.1